jgi:hypothetical protein
MNKSHLSADNGSTLQAYERCLEKWRRWLRNDPHQALWPRIYSMLLADMTFRAIAAAADADPESALHSPILVRAITTGYASDQALSVRRLTDMTGGTMSLRKLVGELRNNLALMTRDNFVCAGGLSYDENLMGHYRFDRLAGVDEAARRRDWSNARIAHAADLTARQVDPAMLTPTAETVAAAQRQIVRAAEAISAYLLGGPVHGAIIPVFQYSQFYRFEMMLHNPEAMKKAHERWGKMAEERDQWTAGVIEELVAAPEPGAGALRSAFSGKR